MHALMHEGIPNVWAVHFVLFEGVRSVEQFLAFEPDEQESLFRLNKRKSMVRKSYGNANR